MKRYFFTLLLGLSVTIASARIIQNFENITKDIWDPELTDRTGTFFSYDATRAPLAIVENPNKSGINTSEKVVRVQVYTGAPNSGILKINFVGGTPTASEPLVDYPACPTCTDEKYDRLRFKYYKGSLLNRNVELEPNGQAASPKKLVNAQGLDEWEYITFDLENKFYSSFQIRVNRNEAGNGSAVGTAEGDFIYIDDIEFFNSTDGPETAIRLVDVEKTFSCIPLGDDLFRFETALTGVANVRVELISLDGRSTTIYNQVAEGKLEIPFQVKNKGVYLVRTTVNNKPAKTIKIVSQ
jgi:hypothetical protein